jgi:hypothetical protein
MKDRDSAIRRSLRAGRRLGLVALAVGSFGLSMPALAQSKAPTLRDVEALGSRERDAVAAFKEGKRALEAGNLLLALEHFATADRLVAGAAPRFLMGQIHEKLGRPVDAVASYRAFLAMSPEPTSTYGKHLPEVKARLAELEQYLPGEVRVRVEPQRVQPVLVVDGVAGARSPLSLAPGPHSLVVTSAGYRPRAEALRVAPGERRELVVVLQPDVASVAPLPREHPATRPASRTWPAIACFSVAAATAIVGGVFGGLALRDERRFNADPTLERADAAERHALLSDLFLGAAFASSAAGAVLLFAGRNDGRSAFWFGAPSSMIVTGTGAMAGWTF